jgi:two-component system, LytTR family, response regulator
MFSCLIIDDEPNAVKLLETYVAKTSCLELKSMFYDGMEALDYFKSGNTIDVIFSDIQMPLLSGIDLADLLPPSQKFIFTTAYAQHALPAFSFFTVDYLLKPITLKRFQQAINKLELVSKSSNVLKAMKEENFIYLKSGKQYIKIMFDETLYIMGAKEYADVHTHQGHFLVYKRLKEMEQLLPSYFIRVHLSYIVNTRLIERVSLTELIIKGKSIPISESYRPQLMTLLSGKF